MCSMEEMKKSDELILKHTVINYSVIAKLLGISNVKELIHESIEVDQHKLELKMGLKSQRNNNKCLEEIFDTIQNETKTHILWPTDWRVDAPYKKPPYVGIIGKPKSVKKAKDKISQLLGVTSARVILKFEIPYSYFSYLIGINGATIKAIKEETNAKHIHFPIVSESRDENNNEVTIYGSLKCIEHARWLLRQACPFIVSFVIDKIDDQDVVLKEVSSIVKFYDTKYNVETLLLPRTKSKSILFMIKGFEKDKPRIRLATMALLKLTNQWSTSREEVEMHIIIDENHHTNIRGMNDSNVYKVMKNTNTVIRFPNLDEIIATGPPKNRHSIIITGTFDDAYNAKQQIMGNLPISLVFICKDVNRQATFKYIQALNQKFSVIITLEALSAQTYIVTIQAEEKFVESVYLCRQKLLNDRELIKPKIPENYFPIHKHDHSQCEKKIPIIENHNVEVDVAQSRTIIEPKCVEFPKLHDNIIDAHSNLPAISTNIDNNLSAHFYMPVRPKAGEGDSIPGLSTTVGNTALRNNSETCLCLQQINITQASKIQNPNNSLQIEYDSFQNPIDRSDTPTLPIHLNNTQHSEASGLRSPDDYIRRLKHYAKYSLFSDPTANVPLYKDESYQPMFTLRGTHPPEFFMPQIVNMPDIFSGLRFWNDESTNSRSLEDVEDENTKLHSALKLQSKFDKSAM